MTLPPNFIYKTRPRGKQREAVENTWNWNEAAFLCRPGTGKTFMCLVTAALNYLDGRIDGLLVIAPEGIDRQWLKDGVPTHLPDNVPRVCGNYRSAIGDRAHDALRRALITNKDGAELRILTLSYDGLQTKRGHAIARDFVSKWRTMVVVDESHRCSNIKSAVHKAVKPIVRAGRVRRIATGTLVRQNPFSAYGQFDLVADRLLGFGSLSSFKSMYAEMLSENNWLVKQLITKVPRDSEGKPRYTPQVQAKGEDGRPIYRNLKDLRQRLEKYSVFLTLEDVNGEEPLVNQTAIPVRLTKAQQVMYGDLVRWGVAQAPSGQLTAEGALALSIRLSQVTGGHAPSDDDPNAAMIPGGNPKLEALLELCEELGDESIVVWCKFSAEIDAVVGALASRYGPRSVVQYHGRMASKIKDDNKRRFIEDDNARFFVGQQKAGGTGLDGLQVVARYMVFYSNDYPYYERLQAISRLARTGGSGVVQVWDIEAEGTIDEDIASCLRAAQDVSEQVLQKAINK